MNGFIVCRRGCTHWGPHSAAGLLIRQTDETGTRYLMQRRSPWVQHGGTWSIPGGALHLAETPEQGACREAREELGVLPHITPVTTITDDHGGWAYYTVIVDTPTNFIPLRGDGEATAHQWTRADDIQLLQLHPGFAATWPRVLNFEGVMP